jgi:hypothetical protein
MILIIDSHFDHSAIVQALARVSVSAEVCMLTATPEPKLDEVATIMAMAAITNRFNGGWEPVILAPMPVECELRPVLPPITREMEGAHRRKERDYG